MLKLLTKRLIKCALETEMTEHFGDRCQLNPYAAF